MFDESEDVRYTDSDLSEEESDSTVTFKCIGVTRETSYQNYLEKVSQLFLEGKQVPVKPEPEPNNPFDSRAVAFQCQLGKKWCTIGYVIKELCDSVHDAISSDSIICSKFAWVKYKVVKKTGPGFYAAIDITRRGTWPPIVHSRANTMT